MSTALVLRQPDVDGAEAVAAALESAFVTVRAAIGEGRAVVIVVSDADLLGQRTVDAAALANGLLGLARAVAMEGAREGWTINVVSDGGDADAVAAAVDCFGRGGALTGQLVRVGVGHLGRVPV